MFDPGAPIYARGAWLPVFPLLLLPFGALFFWVFRRVRKELDWKALAATTLWFEVFMLLAERYSLARGHWVYNESRILGPRVFGVPIEEPLLYYWFPGLLVITVFLYIRQRFAMTKTSRRRGRVS